MTKKDAGSATGGEEEKKNNVDTVQAKKKQKKGANSTPKPTPLQELVANIKLLATSVEEKDVRGMNKAVRNTTAIRAKLVAKNLARVAAFLPNDVQPSYVAVVDKLKELETAAAASEDVDMGGDGSDSKAEAGAGDDDDDDVDMGSSSAGEKGGSSSSSTDSDSKAGTSAAEVDAKVTIEPSRLPEVHVYVQLLALKKLLACDQNQAALEFATELVSYAKKFNRRTLDMFSAKVYAALSLAHERQGSLDTIRGDLMKAHRTSSLRHDEIGKATLLNLLLRNYLHYNLYEQANKLRLRAAFPKAISNNQLVRYLYYTGRIQAVHMDYSDAFESLNQATRKAPTTTAVGFRCTVHRLLTVVKLLMGELPDRGVFRETSLRAALRPHFRLTQAVRVGNLALFNKVLQEYETDFKSDATYSLILRLRNNVIKAGLRKLSIAYSTISFADIAVKLHLDSAEDAAFLTAKAIKDGVVDGALDFERGALVSNNTVDVYSTTVPQDAFHTRIKFCLDVHNEAVKGMVYPPNAHRQRAAVDAEQEEELDEEAIAKAAAEEEEEDDE